MTMPGRSYNAGSGYRYGFNGKENDKDISEGGQDYGMRIYDSRLGRFLSVDPLTKEYPWNSTYAFAEDNPIRFIDLDGLEKADPKLINKNIPAIVKQHSEFIYNAFNNAANFQWNNLEKYSKNQTTNIGTIKGVVGEGIVAYQFQQVMDFYKYDSDDYSFAFGENQSTDLSLTVDLRDEFSFKKWGRKGFKYEYKAIGFNFNNADGSSNWEYYTTGVKKFIFEVKTNAIGVSASKFELGIDQLILNIEAQKNSGNSQVDDIIGVFVVDEAAWNTAYKLNPKKLDKAVEKLQAAGGNLALLPNLNKDAVNQMRAIKRKINANANNNNNQEEKVDGDD